MKQSFLMNFEKLEELKLTLNDHHYVEYIYNKFFDNPAAEFDSRKNHCVWSYPECWLARYYCYYVVNGHYLQNQTILDLGANFNFYSTWAVINGAQSSVCIEPDQTRFALAQEYVKIRNLDSKITSFNMSLDTYMQQYQDQKFDVVFLLDVFYYLTNGINVLQFIKDKIKPKFLFFESTVTQNNDHSDFTLWKSSTDTTKFQSFSNNNAIKQTLSLTPSKSVLDEIFKYFDFEVVSYYDYHDFIGRGESPPRQQGNKVFYILKIT